MRLTLILIFLVLVKFSFSQSSAGTVTVDVKDFCEIIVRHPNRPIHFTCNRKWQHRSKHVKVISNCKWTLSVRPKGRYLYCNQNKIDGNLISYRIVNAHGIGQIESPEATYLLYQTPYAPPFGTGSVEFDVVFSLDTNLLRNVRWGNYNTKLNITCTPGNN